LAAALQQIPAVSPARALIISYCSGSSGVWAWLFRLGVLAFLGVSGGDVDDGAQAIRLTDEQRIDWLRLIRSQNVGPRGIMAQTPLLVAFGP
jgi:hypothetical protein